MLKDLNIKMDKDLYDTLNKISKGIDMNVSEIVCICCYITLADIKMWKKFKDNIDKS